MWWLVATVAVVLVLVAVARLRHPRRRRTIQQDAGSRASDQRWMSEGGSDGTSSRWTFPHSG
jgi:hypothetical protein